MDGLTSIKEEIIFIIKDCKVYNTGIFVLLTHLKCKLMQIDTQFFLKIFYSYQFCFKFSLFNINFESMQASQTNPILKGYLYIMIQNYTFPEAQSEVTCNISLGLIAKCNTTPTQSGKVINEVFLIEVPEDPSRLIFQFKEKDQFIGDCRYDVNPFFTHPGSAHTISSDIFNNSNQNKGTVNTKITYYSAEFGKLKVRVFHLSLSQSFVDKFKTARLKVKSGIYVQSSPEWAMDKEFDHSFDLLILVKNGNLQLDVFCQEGTLAKYTIYDLQKSNLLLDQIKAYQVSLFNNEKAVGTIKYQVEWIH